MTSRVECQVCAESRPHGQIIMCGACSYTSCKHCTERYILSIADDPHCMNCKSRFGRAKLLEYFSASFMNTKYRDWRKGVLLQREMAMLQVTQPHVERELKRRENNKLLRQLQTERAAHADE